MTSLRGTQFRVTGTRYWPPSVDTRYRTGYDLYTGYLHSSHDAWLVRARFTLVSQSVIQGEPEGQAIALPCRLHIYLYILYK